MIQNGIIQWRPRDFLLTDCMRTRCGREFFIYISEMRGDTGCLLNRLLEADTASCLSNVGSRYVGESVFCDYSNIRRSVYFW